MKGGVVVACTVVGILGLITACLGFAAESKRIKRSDVIVTGFVCEYRKTQAPALALLAAFTLLVAQIVINVVTCCVCCRPTNPRSSNTRRTTAQVAFPFSWITFLIAFPMFLVGAAVNLHISNLERTTCYVAKPGILSGAAILSIVSVCLGIFCYVALESSEEETAANYPYDPYGAQGPAFQQSQGGIAMAQPQFQQSSGIAMAQTQFQQSPGISMAQPQCQQNPGIARGQQQP